MHLYYRAKFQNSSVCIFLIIWLTSQINQTLKQFFESLYMIHDAMNHILPRDRCFIYNIIYRMAWCMSNVKGRNNISCLTRRAQGNILSLTFGWEGSSTGNVGSKIKREGNQEWRFETGFHLWVLWIPNDGEWLAPGFYRHSCQNIALFIQMEDNYCTPHVIYHFR